MKKVILANITIIVVFVFFLELVSNFFKLSNLKGIEPGLIIANGDIHQMSANSSGTVSYTHLTLPTNREV